MHGISNSTITGIYTENTANNRGRANYVWDISRNSIIDGTYTRNHAEYGGANAFAIGLDNVNITGAYTENTATEQGGANYFGGRSTDLYIDAVYNDNSANEGSDEYFFTDGGFGEDTIEEIDEPIDDNTTDNTTTKNINNDKTGKLQKTYKNKQYMKTTKDNKSNTHSTKTTFKQGTSITLRMLNEIFTQIFNNKTILIYIGDVLVYNGTLGDDLSEILFTITNDFKGNYSLKVVSDGNTYTKEIEII